MNEVANSANIFCVRLVALALAIAGILFVLYPALRPFSDEVSLQGAEAFASPAWILAHVLAMLAFILLALALWGLHSLLEKTALERLAFLAFVVGWIGIGLTLPFYGAEAFGLSAIGQEALRQQNDSLMNLALEIRTGTGLYIFLAGLLVLGLATILAAIAIWKSKSLPKWSGIPLAIGFISYIPQFFFTQPVRVAHGVLVAIGCLWIAFGIWRQSDKQVS